MSDYINTIDEEEKYVIDSNDRIVARMEEYNLRQERMRQDELQKRVTTFFESLEYDEEGKAIIPTDEEGNYLIPFDDEGSPLVNIDEEGNILELSESENPNEGFAGDYEGEELFNEESNVSSMTPEEIIEQANREAERIIAEATEHGEALKSHYKQDGIDEGYKDGLAKASEEYREKQMALEAERQSFLAEYQSERDSMEAELCEVICDVVEKVFRVKFSDSKDLVLQLVDNALMGVSGSKTFIIRVSEKNHKALQDNKERLLSRLGSEVILDIIMDPLMNEDGCMIETDGGIINCGLDVELRELFKNLKLLSAT